MDHLRPKPKSRRTVSARVQQLISYAWIIASLALPALGLAVLAGGALAPVDRSATTHVVRAGETLSAIARRYGVTVEELVQTNGLNNPDLIYAGQILTIPIALEAGTSLYTVQQGETLSEIAARYGVPVESIMAVNGLPTRDSIAVGQQLVIPPAVQPDDAPALDDASTVYTLQRGDSLYRVALIYGVSVDDLLAANNLASPSAIYPGLELRVPQPPRRTADTLESGTGAPGGALSGERVYTVQLGDTLAQIAQSHNVPVDRLIAVNGLTGPDRIYVGQQLRIPEEGAAARPAPAQAAVSHTVLPGETLSAIAMRYGVTLHSLAVANDLNDSAHIYPGMTLSIPSALAGANSVAYASTGPGLCADVTPRRSGTGYFIRPTPRYNFTQGYSALHAGVDLAIDAGTPVFAADSGTVVYAGWNPVGYGNLVVLDHGNGWRTYYAHLQSVHVRCGEWLSRGSTIGEIGSTGNSSGPHLHFEMLRFGIAVNPAGYIRF